MTAQTGEGGTSTSRGLTAMRGWRYALVLRVSGTWRGADLAQGQCGPR